MESPDALTDTIVMLLAGGQGERLHPLTRDRAKPAVPFGGNYRIIDFALSNCINSGLRRILVLTQYKSDSLNTHLRLGWDFLDRQMGEYVETHPAQQRPSAGRYTGTAHAVFQSIYSLERERPRYVLVLSGDHVCRMDYSRMLEAHIRADAHLTVACVEQPLDKAAGRLGVVVANPHRRLLQLQEKPPAPAPMPGRTDSCLCSMGIYVFNTEILVRRLIEDAKHDYEHDFARNVIPNMLQDNHRMFVFPFEGHYWRDIGTIDAYWEAHMDLVADPPCFDLYDADWPIRGHARCRPPANLRSGDAPASARKAGVSNSLIANGAIVDGATVYRSVIGPDVRIGNGSRVEQSVLMDGVAVGRNVVIKNAIVDKDNTIPDNMSIGVDPGRDRRYACVSEAGIVVVPSRTPFPETLAEER